MLASGDGQLTKRVCFEMLEKLEVSETILAMEGVPPEAKELAKASILEVSSTLLHSLDVDMAFHVFIAKSLINCWSYMN